MVNTISVTCSVLPLLILLNVLGPEGKLTLPTRVRSKGLPPAREDRSTHNSLKVNLHQAKAEAKTKLIFDFGLFFDFFRFRSDLRLIYISMKAKVKQIISLIFVTTQCKHTTGKSMYPFQAMSLLRSLSLQYK